MAAAPRMTVPAVQIAPQLLSHALSSLAFMSAFIHPILDICGSVGSGAPTSTQYGTTPTWLDRYQYQALLSAAPSVASASNQRTIRTRSDAPRRSPPGIRPRFPP